MPRAVPTRRPMARTREQQLCACRMHDIWARCASFLDRLRFALRGEGSYRELPAWLWDPSRYCTCTSSSWKCSCGISRPVCALSDEHRQQARLARFLPPTRGCTSAFLQPVCFGGKSLGPRVGPSGCSFCAAHRLRVCLVRPRRAAKFFSVRPRPPPSDWASSRFC